MIHTLPLELHNLHGHFSRDLAPIVAPMMRWSRAPTMTAAAWEIEGDGTSTRSDAASLGVIARAPRDGPRAQRAESNAAVRMVRKAPFG